MLRWAVVSFGGVPKDRSAVVSIGGPPRDRSATDASVGHCKLRWRTEGLGQRRGLRRRSEAAEWRRSDRCFLSATGSYRSLGTQPVRRWRQICLAASTACRKPATIVLWSTSRSKTFRTPCTARSPHLPPPTRLPLGKGPHRIWHRLPLQPPRPPRRAIQYRSLYRHLLASGRNSAATLTMDFDSAFSDSIRGRVVSRRIDHYVKKRNLTCPALAGSACLSMLPTSLEALTVIGWPPSNCVVLKLSFDRLSSSEASARTLLSPRRRLNSMPAGRYIPG